MASLWFLVLILVNAYTSYAKGNEYHLRKSFPKGFVFGTSSSAYQYEGAVAEGGRGPSIWENFSHIPGKIADGSTADVTVDQYHRYKEDVGLMVDLGVDVYRLSISWSRLLPNGVGFLNKEGIRYYNNLINELLSKGIQPFVTLSHFDVPQALEDAYGSWLSSRIVDDFAAFSEICFDAFGDRVKHWITLNEPHAVCDYGYNTGILLPQRCSPEVNNCTHGDSSTEPYVVCHNFLLSHAAAVHIYNKKFKAKQGGYIGTTLDAMWFEPLTSSSKDVAAAKRSQEFNLAWLMDPIVFGDYPPLMRSVVGNKLPKFTKQQSTMLRGSFDFVGINHYTSIYVAHSDNPVPVPGVDLNQQAYYRHTNARYTDTKKNGRLIGRRLGGFNFYPLGMRKLLNYIRRRYNNPTIFITENGVVDTNSANATLQQVLRDNSRIQFLGSYIANVAAAIRDGCDVRGYLVWSLFDNWEWINGRSVKMGLYHIDYQNNLTRIPKNSALWYKRFLHAQKS